MTSPFRFVIHKRLVLAILLAVSQVTSASRAEAASPAGATTFHASDGRRAVGESPTRARPPSQGPGGDTVLDADLISESSIPAVQTVGEQAGTVSVPVTLDLPTVFPLDVNYTVEAGSARPGENYQMVSGTVTFAGPLDLIHYIDVPIVDNDYHTGPIAFTVRLVSQSSGDPLPDASTTAVTILDDEPVPSASIAAPADGYAVPELSGTAQITVAIPFTSTNAISVTYTTEDSTAIAGVDYQATSGEVLIPTGQISATIPVTILANAAFTGDRFFTVRLLGQSPGVLGAPASASVTILDAQEQPQVEFELPAFNVARNTGTAPITATLNAPSAFTVTVDYATTNGTATGGVDYTSSSGTLTFAPGETVKVVPVTILNSGAYVGDRTFTISLTNPQQATLGDTSQATVSIRETNAVRVYMALVLWSYSPLTEDEPNGTMATAKGPLQSNATYVGRYDFNRVDQFGLDRDTWRFTVLAPGPVTVTVVSNDSGRQVKLLNASGVDVPGGFSGDPGPSATFTVNVAAAGTYYVRVFSSAALGNASYQLRVTHP